MFKVISFQANGERVEHLGQRVAFFGLVRDGRIVDYFGTLAALKLAVASIETIERAEADTSFVFELRIAA